MNSIREAPFFSYIVPVYNAEKWLKQCLSSIKDQTFGNFEAIIINDGSTDKSRLIIQSFVDADPRFKFFEQKNAGSSSAYNRGIELSKGKYLCFLDNDDWNNPEALASTYETILRDDPDIVQFKVIEFDDTDNKEISVRYEERAVLTGQTSIRDGYVAREFDSLTHSGKALRRDLITKYQLQFDGFARGADVFFIRKLFAVSNTVVINPNAEWHMRIRQESQSHRRIEESERAAYHKYAVDSVLQDIPFYKNVLTQELLSPIWQLDNLAFDSFFAYEKALLSSGQFTKKECRKYAVQLWQNRKYILSSHKRRLFIFMTILCPKLMLSLQARRHA